MQLEASYFFQDKDKMNSSDEFIRGVCAGVEYAYNKLSIKLTPEQRKSMVEMCSMFLEAEKKAYEDCYT